MPSVSISLTDEQYRWYSNLPRGERSAAVQEAIAEYRENGEAATAEGSA